MSSTIDPGYLRGSSSVVTPPAEEIIFPGTESVDPSIVLGAPGYTSYPEARNGVATAALWLSLPGIVLFPLAIVVLILGVSGLIVAGQNQGVGRRQAIGSLIISGSSLLLTLLLFSLV